MWVLPVLRDTVKFGPTRNPRELCMTLKSRSRVPRLLEWAFVNARSMLIPWPPHARWATAGAMAPPYELCARLLQVVHTTLVQLVLLAERWS